MIFGRKPDELSDSNGGETDVNLPKDRGKDSAADDLYSSIFSDANEGSEFRHGAKNFYTPPIAKESIEIPIPAQPFTLAETGLTLGQVSDLLLKTLYLQGSLIGMECSDHLRLPFSVVDEGLLFLTEEKCIEVASAEMLGRVSYKFHLTDLGRTRAREAFEQCKYVGPAPVPLEVYVRQCRAQTVAGIECDEQRLISSFENFIVREGLIDELGPAVCSGKSIFVYGPPGNGKTMIAKGLGTFLNRFGGEIFIPYAIQTESNIITMFDPTVHQATDQNQSVPISRLPSGDRPLMMDSNELDRRWRKIRRPVIITGGELNLEMLELRYDKTANYYQAPLHIKANGGVFLIDDFGRQLVSPKELLNRWIVPLEEKIDYLSLVTGKKIAVPFEQLIVFSTNLDPKELVDDAFLRRIRHKIEIGPPSRELIARIFEMECERRSIPFDTEVITYLFANHYNSDRLPRSSDPRDLLEILQSICRFKNQPQQFTSEILNLAASRFFSQLK